MTAGGFYCRNYIQLYLSKHRHNMLFLQRCRGSSAGGFGVAQGGFGVAVGGFTVAQGGFTVATKSCNAVIARGTEFQKCSVLYSTY